MNILLYILQNVEEQEKLKTDFKESLQKVLRSEEKQKHFSKIYFVSNTCNTKHDVSVIEEIRNEISHHGLNKFCLDRDCPPKWLLFQQVLGKLEDNNVPISTTTRLSKIAEHVDIGIPPEKELKQCLQYFHDNGTLIYFEEENLKDYVILDPKWFVNAFRCLVSDKTEPTMDDSDDWKTLTETGELTDKLISDQFKKEPKSKFLRTNHIY
ncbi:unnamed protein product [Mytilus edulis]|uniref:COR domain-containing protein n=1 Tax=Mytilus edulis TaxID=6550 RepID=A0A8S3RIM3_MYTED|nr:unnamed protein product [Mytilus edulis]